MRLLRNTWLQRLLAGFMLVSMLPVLAGPMVDTAGRTAPHGYAEWMRTQMAGQVDAKVEQALQAALAQPARSFEEFAGAVVSAYEAAAPQASLGTAFAAAGLSNAELVQYLNGRYSNRIDGATVPQGQWRAATLTIASVPGRCAALLDTRPADTRATFASLRAAVRHIAATVYLPVRIVFAARPLGP